MEWRQLPEIIAALAFFGLLFVVPLVMLFLRHQRMMAELIHRNAGSDVDARIAALEAEIRDLRGSLYEQVIRQDTIESRAQRVSN